MPDYRRGDRNTILPVKHAHAPSCCWDCEHRCDRHPTGIPTHPVRFASLDHDPACRANGCDQ